MEDTKDEMSHKGKKYYLSHSTWVHNLEHPLYEVFGNHESQLTQLVCASNKKKAREAVEAGLIESCGKDITIFKIRIDNPIVGE